MTLNTHTMESFKMNHFQRSHRLERLAGSDQPQWVVLGYQMGFSITNYKKMHFSIMQKYPLRTSISVLCKQSLFQMVLEKADHGKSKRKRSISALLTMPKPLTVWIMINCGKLWKRWEYQTTWPASWETCMQVRKQQLELDMEQHTGSFSNR